MREGFDAPTLQLKPEDVAALRSVFDGQSRVRLAVWVRHEQQGVDGPLYDHHLVLGVPDDDYATGDMWALELGLPLPGLQFDAPIWAPDLFPLSEVEGLRAFGTVIWEGHGGADPLDYSLTWEPLEADSGALSRFARALAAEPGIRRVEATRQRLWKGGDEVRSEYGLFVDAAGVPRAVSIVDDAARAAAVVPRSGGGVSLGLPHDARIHTATLYEAAQ